MKNLLTLLFTFVAVSSVAQGLDPNRYKNGMPHHPFRKIGKKYFDLRKLYEWDQVQMNLKIGETGSAMPLKDWIGDDHGGSQYKVYSVLKEGLLIEKRNFGNPYGEPFLLVNYPMEKTVVDGQTIRFFAMRSGQFKYWDKTVERYDYGTPYDPVAMKSAADAQKTNSTAGISVTNASPAPRH